LTAPVAAVTLTDVDDDVADAGCQVPACCNASEAVLRLASLLLTDCQAVIAFSWSETLVLSFACPCDSTCMSWLITWLVLIPLIRPSTLLVIGAHLL
jgi:hypothetical protein